MYIKRYTIASAILIGFIGWYVNAYISHDKLGINFFGIQLPELSIAVWVVASLVLIYIASVLHMSFYSLLSSLKLRKYNKDADVIIDSIIDAYLGKDNRKHNFKTQRYKTFGDLIDNTSLMPHPNMPRSSNEKINNILSIIEDVKKGKSVELKPYGLKSSNPLVVQNNRNRYNNEEITAEDILSHSADYSKDLCKEVYGDYAKIASLHTIEKYKEYMTKNTLFDILSRVNVEKNNLEIPNESFVALFSTLDLDEDDFVEISIALSHNMVPEQRIKLFEILSENSEIAMKAYLFTLFDLEMIELASDILDNSQPEEYLKFKAYNELKDANKHYGIELFL